jgi:hypothetical protein
MSLYSFDLIGLIAIVGGFFIATVGIIAGTLRRNTRVREVEQTKRELAAYVAEGSMTADDAEKILNSGRRSSDGEER